MKLLIIEELHPKKDRNCGEDYSIEIMVYEMKNEICKRRYWKK